jgi:acyl-CoA dehydrogenase
VDFNDTPQEAEFREEVRAWLAANAEERGGIPRRAENPEAELKRAKEWQAKKADAGYGFIQWPEEYGGRGSTIFSVIYAQEEAKYAVPYNYFINATFIGPTMMAYASEEQKKRYLPPMLRGDEVWCQLFSEPAAGSDLAGIRTRAERDGDEWVINGQKVWTSFAHLSDYGVLVTRHDPGARKHHGLTYFFIDMKTPGIEIVPIKQISGGSEFNEVFLSNVRVPDAQRLGEVGDGWSVAITTLMNERFATGGASRPDTGELIEFARRQELEDGPAIDNPGVREKLADWYVQAQGITNIQSRTLTALSKGQQPGPEASIAKVVNANKLQAIGSFGMDLQDMGGVIVQADEAFAQAIFQQGFMGAPGGRIAGGTDEIMRNIIAERVLGLPGDIRVDKEVPFNELPVGSA